MDNANGLTDGCDGDKTTEKRTVNQSTAVEGKVQDLNLMVYHRKGSVNDAELKAFLEQFGEVIKLDAGSLQRSVIMHFSDIESKREVLGKHIIKEGIIEVESQVDSDKEERQDCGIERYFYNPRTDGDSCLLRQIRGYEVEVLPKTIPEKEVKNQVTVQIYTDKSICAHDIRHKLERAIRHMETHWSIAVVIPTVQISAPYPLTIVRFSSSHNYQDDPQYCALMEKVCSTLQQKFNL